ncbi:MAG: efflux RND transporter periplasmic adaptor subunit [wastewater metagenome]|nr:efflux RND transporter periplasmic adaptor subunit [Candidatus Loosdrechtia aerotolerans]
MKNSLIHFKKILAVGVLILVGIILAFVILRIEKTTVNHPHEHTHGDTLHQEEEDGSRGPHGGRLLSDTDFQIEIAVYERGIPPHFRVYPLYKGHAVDPGKVKLIVELYRLGGRVDVIQFQEEGEYLRSEKIIEEPHSFDVKVVAEWEGNSYRWEYSQREGRVVLSPEALRNSGIIVETAGPVQIRSTRVFPGEIKLNADKVVHVVPRVSGVVVEVYKNLGDAVRHGEVMAVLDSREIAELRSEYRASVKWLELVQANFQRKERLWRQRISPEREYLESRQELAEAEIRLQEVTQKLLTLGFSQDDLNLIPEKIGENLSRYEIRALFDGTVIEKHITVGEAIGENADIFVLADLSTVWVEVTIYARDLKVVRIGQDVVVRSDIVGIETEGTLTYIAPLVGEQTRTARGRVVIQNTEGLWRPGLFVTVEVIYEEVRVPVGVSADAIQTLDNHSGVFVKYDNVFEFHPLELGRRSEAWVEVLDGISPGEQYAVRNSFILKADLGKAGAVHEH